MCGRRPRGPRSALGGAVLLGCRAAPRSLLLAAAELARPLCSAGCRRTAAPAPRLALPPAHAVRAQFEPADYAYFLTFAAGACLVAGAVLGIPLLGTPLIMSVIYVWSRNFPDQHIMLYGLVKIQSFYLPFAFLAISVLLGQDLTPDLIGIVVGHLYWYLHDVMPGQVRRYGVGCTVLGGGERPAWSRA